MQSGSYWAYREAGAFDQDPDEGLEVRVLSSGEHTARKAHGCAGCEGLIEPGQRYGKTVMLDEGRFEIQRVHADAGECQASRLAVEARRKAEAKAMFEAEAKAMFEAWSAQPAD